MSDAPVMTDSPRTTVTPTSAVLPWGLLAVFLLNAGPLFLRMPLTNDAELYDLQAAVVRQGGVLYRDLLEPNLPGVVWLHLAVRSVLGDSSEALRLFDLLMLAGTVTAAGLLIRLAGRSWSATGWTAFGLTAAYLSQSEWCHCQRDGWMLFPALMAIVLRTRNLQEREAASVVTNHWRAFAEGVCWGCAVWLKPYIVVPAIGVWLVSLVRSHHRRRFIGEFLALLAGGLLVGGLGIGWMITSGCWPYFLETAREWNPAYFAAGRAHWTWLRLAMMGYRFAPWILLHGAALLVITAAVIRWSLDRFSSSPTDDGLRATDHPIFALVAAAYLGWTAQALFLQHQFDYVFAPTLLLALLVVGTAAIDVTGPPRLPVGWLAFGLMVLVSSPWTEARRLQSWPQAMLGPNSPALQDRLAHFQNPNRRDLAAVAEYLQAAAVTDQDVCCYNSDFVSLYRRLSLTPPMKFTYLFEILQFFPDRQDTVLEAVERSPHRFVVTDLVSCGLSRKDAEAVGPAGPHAPPPAYRLAPKDVYPWNCPVVFRAGTYLVHRVSTDQNSTTAAVTD